LQHCNLAIEVLRRNILLTVVSTAVDALGFTYTVLSTVLVKLKSEIISESNFPFDNLIRYKATKLMQILKRTGIDWRERRLVGKFYMNQRVIVRLDRGETRSVQIGRGVRQGYCLSAILFNLYNECLTKEALDGLGDFNIGGEIIQTVKYADELVVVVKK